jgi:hypothetical protein
MNPSVSFTSRVTLPIQSHKIKSEALCQLILRLVHQKIIRYSPHAHLADLLDHEF